VLVVHHECVLLEHGVYVRANLGLVFSLLGLVVLDVLLLNREEVLLAVAHLQLGAQILDAGHLLHCLQFQFLFVDVGPLPVVEFLDLQVGFDVVRVDFEHVGVQCVVILPDAVFDVVDGLYFVSQFGFGMHHVFVCG